MPTTNEWKQWEKAMKVWFKELLKWQLANPTKDWLQEMGTADTNDADDSGGSNPLPPPPPPPTHG